MKLKKLLVFILAALGALGGFLLAGKLRRRDRAPRRPAYVDNGRGIRDN